MGKQTVESKMQHRVWFMLGWVESDMGIISAREEVQLKIEYQG